MFYNVFSCASEVWTLQKCRRSLKITPSVISELSGIKPFITIAYFLN